MEDSHLLAVRKCLLCCYVSTHSSHHAWWHLILGGQRIRLPSCATEVTLIQCKKMPGYDFNRGVRSYDFSVIFRHEEYVPIWYARSAKTVDGKLGVQI